VNDIDILIDRLADLRAEVAALKEKP